MQALAAFLLFVSLFNPELHGFGPLAGYAGEAPTMTVRFFQGDPLEETRTIDRSRPLDVRAEVTFPANSGASGDILAVEICAEGLGEIGVEACWPLDPQALDAHPVATTYTFQATLPANTNDIQMGAYRVAGTFALRDPTTSQDKGGGFVLGVGEAPDAGDERNGRLADVVVLDGGLAQAAPLSAERYELAFTRDETGEHPALFDRLDPAEASVTVTLSEAQAAQGGVLYGALLLEPYGGADDPSSIGFLPVPVQPGTTEYVLTPDRLENLPAGVYTVAPFIWQEVEVEGGSTVIGVGKTSFTDLLFVMEKGRSPFG